jgi:hypothetical protein
MFNMVALSCYCHPSLPHPISPGRSTGIRPSFSRGPGVAVDKKDSSFSCLSCFTLLRETIYISSACSNLPSSLSSSDMLFMLVSVSGCFVPGYYLHHPECLLMPLFRLSNQHSWLSIAASLSTLLRHRRLGHLRFGNINSALCLCIILL